MSASHYRIKGASPQVRVLEVRQSLFNNFVDVRCSLKGRFPRKLLISKAHEINKADCDLKKKQQRY